MNDRGRADRSQPPESHLVRPTHPPQPEVVLLSAVPEAHGEMVRAMRLEGVAVRIPQPAIPRGLRIGHADLILVDLVHGPGLTRQMIAALNRRAGRSMVVALHEGSLDSGFRAAPGLAIEGFCHSGDCLPALRALVARSATLAPILH